MKSALLVCAGAAMMVSPLPSARADTSAVTPSAFVSTFREAVKATPDAMWKAMVQLPRWWSGQHTYSGQAANLSLDVQAGGCWCERAGDGLSVQHGTVVLVQPGRAIRLFANRAGPTRRSRYNGEALRVSADDLSATLVVLALPAATGVAFFDAAVVVVALAAAIGLLIAGAAASFTASAGHASAGPAATSTRVINRLFMDRSRFGCRGRRLLPWPPAR